MKRVVFDTNVFIDWLNRGAHEERVLGPGSVRLLSSVVEMELRAGASTPAARRTLDRITKAYASAARVLCPTPRVFTDAGEVLRRLSRRGVEVRRASIVNDVLIALSARSIGATVVTRDADLARIHAVIPFSLEMLDPSPP